MTSFESRSDSKHVNSLNIVKRELMFPAADTSRGSEEE